ncbi:MAG: hypothetical protein AB7S38_26230 [Vulcanimicrobiota bacterium]
MPYRYEVIEGKLYATAPPTIIHQILSKRLLFQLYELELAGDGYRIDTVLGAEDRHCPPDLAGVEFDMRKLFADLPAD